MLADGRVYAADRDRLEIWSPSLTRRIEEVSFPNQDPPLPRSSVVLSPNGRFIAVDDAAYDIVARKFTLPSAQHATVSAVSFAGDAFLLTAGYHDQAVRVRSLSSESSRAWTAPDPVVAAALTRDGSLVVIATRAGAFSSTLETTRPLAEWTGSGIVGICILGDDQRVAVLAKSRLHLLDVRTLEETAHAELDADATALACDGDLIAMGDAEGRVYAFEEASHRLLGRRVELRGAVRALALSGGARRIIAVTNDDRGAEAVLLGVP